MAAVSRVTSCSVTYQAALGSYLCNDESDSSLMAYSLFPTGVYSLTRCVTPSIDVCDSAGTSPEWLAVLYQNTFNAQFGNANPVTFANGLPSDACKTDYLRVSCTIPTCTSDDKLQGTLSFDQCNRAYDW